MNVRKALQDCVLLLRLVRRLPSASESSSSPSRSPNDRVARRVEWRMTLPGDPFQ
jgi:hypothetical protein